MPQEEEEQEQFWHRRQCANRLFIGPWDIKAPLPESTAEHLANHVDNDTSDILVSPKQRSSANTRASTGLSPTASDGTSFVTARSNATATTPYLGVFDDDDEDIDYQFLQETRLLDTNDDNESIRTIKPTKKQGKLPMNPITTTTAISTPYISGDLEQNKKKRRPLTTKKKKKTQLHWKKSGHVYVSQNSHNSGAAQQLFVPSSKPIKREPILCMMSVARCNESVPTRYKANKEAIFDLLTEKWRQVELVLTNSFISTYASSTLFWPKRRLEHRVYLEGKRKPKQLELFLLSSLDYTFCLRYTSTEKKAMVETLTFKARSFLKCQEWYMKLYDMLSTENKRPYPPWCQVYIPTLDLSVNLPLINMNKEDINMEEVKEAVLTILEDEQADSPGVDALLTSAEQGELAFCWATKDRAEWIYWITSSSNPAQRIDWAVCPQNIEQTHRLELRTIQHTPHDIILKQDFVLKEPSPVEGYLLSISDFFGTANKYTRKIQYFASFDQYLFYVPNKIKEPNFACYSKLKKEQPYVSGLTPYATDDKLVQAEEVQRRLKLMIEAKGVIDLTEVSYVRRSFVESADESDIRSLGTKSSRSPMLQEEERSENVTRRSSNSLFLPRAPRHKACLELIMENGLQIKFEAYTSETCEAWVNALAQIIVYWKARKEAEKDAHSQGNIPVHHEHDVSVDDGCVHNHKEEELADTRIWSYCLYEQCRDVVKSGILYYKPYKRGSYSQKIFVLTSNGWIIFYDVYNRNTARLTSHHERKGALDIAGCYFYSGVDDSKQMKGSNSKDERAARLYGNGLATKDNTLDCVFSIWKPKLRRYFSSKRQRLRVYHQDQRLNPNGITWTFLARSRREKEEWVCALNTVTEHMIRCNNGQT